MRELNVNELQEVSGGPLPVGAALIVVQVGRVAAKAAKNKKVQETVGIAVGTVVGWFISD